MPQQVEDCVKALMADPDFKPQGDKTKEESAWAVCQAQYQKAHGSIVLEMITEPVNFVVAQEESGEVLRFRNAILVVAETNRNRDTITEEGISEICQSLPGRAIDWDHKFRENVGFFSGATPIKVGDTWGASTDGVIWADRFPEAAEGVRNGTLHLSIEARAETAQCSVCGGIFGEVVEYCQHLLNKIQSGANRILKGLKAVGGALTPKPAGTGTTFDQSKVYFVANHQEADMDEAQYDEIMAKELSYQERKNLARLPNAKGLSSEERAQVKSKAQAKLKSKECQGERKSDTKGGQMTEQTMEEVQAQLDQLTKLYDQEVATREQAQADLASTQEQVATLQAKVSELTTELEGVNTSLTEAVTAHRVQVLTLTGMAGEKVEEAKETISKMDEAAFNLLVASYQKPAVKGSGGFTPDETDGDKPKLILGGAQ